MALRRSTAQAFLFLRSLGAASLFCCALWAAPVTAQTADYRIIMIDNPLYSTIDPRERGAAIANLIADVRMFETKENQAENTMIIYRRGNNIDVLRDMPDGPKVADALNGSALVRNMKSKKTKLKPGFYVSDLGDRLQSIVRSKGLDRPRRDGKKHEVHLHVFGQKWTFGTGNAYSNLHALDVPPICVPELLNLNPSWPQSANLTVEFRTPTGLEQPSASSKGVLIAAITGIGEVQENVRTFGQTAYNDPLCELETSVTYEPQNPSTGANCTLAPKAWPKAHKIAGICRNIPSAPAIGTGLNTNPVNLVSRPSTLVLSNTTLGVTAPLLGLDPKVLLGSETIQPGAPLNLGVISGTFNSRFTLQPPSNCRPGGSGTVTIRDATGMDADITIARVNCGPVDIKLGSVEVK